MLYGILYSCPAGERNSACPLKEIEEFSFKDKVEWYEGLKEEQRNVIKQNHCICSYRRLAKLKR